MFQDYNSGTVTNMQRLWVLNSDLELEFYNGLWSCQYQHPATEADEMFFRMLIIRGKWEGF